jgi:hypothetical protein
LEVHAVQAVRLLRIVVVLGVGKDRNTDRAVLLKIAASKSWAAVLSAGMLKVWLVRLQCSRLTSTWNDLIERLRTLTSKTSERDLFRVLVLSFATPARKV